MDKVKFESLGYDPKGSHSYFSMVPDEPGEGYFFLDHRLHAPQEGDEYYWGNSNLATKGKWKPIELGWEFNKDSYVRRRRETATIMVLPIQHWTCGHKRLPDETRCPICWGWGGRVVSSFRENGNTVHLIFL